MLMLIKCYTGVVTGKTVDDTDENEVS